MKKLTLLFVTLLLLGSFSLFHQASAATTCTVITQDLTLGSRDTGGTMDVTKLQQFLVSSSLLTVAPTGYFGPQTQLAVKLFQSNNGIENTGYVGSLTREKIKNLTCTTNTTVITQPQMSVGQFVELLITIGVISPDKAVAARLAMGCASTGCVTTSVVKPRPRSSGGGGGGGGSSSSPTCTSFTYTEWSPEVCVSGTQTRDVTSQLPAGCTGGSPVQTQSCTVPSVQAPTCTSFTYTDWSPATCTTGTQTHTVTSQSPAGCTGGSPILNQSCTVPGVTTHTVTFNANGGTGSMSNQTMIENTTVNLTANTFIKYGLMFTIYPFIGWSTTVNGPVIYSDQDSFRMESSDVTLYAQWSTNMVFSTCTDFVYSAWSPATCTTGVQNRTITSSSPVGCTGGSPVLSQSCDLFCPAVYSVIYNGNNNTSGTVPPSVLYGINAPVTTMANTGSLRRENHAFLGWNTMPDGSGIDRLAGDIFSVGSANVTLYAKWLGDDSACTNFTYSAWSPATCTTGTQTRTITSQSPAGCANGNPQVLTRSCSTALPDVSITILSPNLRNIYDINDLIPIRWETTGTDSISYGAYGVNVKILKNNIPLVVYSSSNDGSEDAPVSSQSGNIVAGSDYTVKLELINLYIVNSPVYASVTSGAFTLSGLQTGYSIITFYPNGGDGAVRQQIIRTGVPTALNLNTYTRTGYSFIGWGDRVYGKADRTPLIPDGGITSTPILYAGWLPNSGTPATSYVVFEANNGGGSLPAQGITAGTTANLNSNTFSRACHTFAGWALTPDGPVVYADGAPLSIGSSNVILYAKWNPISLSVANSRNYGTALLSWEMVLRLIKALR